MKTIGLFLFILAILGFSILNANDFDRELKEQVAPILKALNYNEVLKERMQKNCIIAVLHRASTSQDEKNAVIDALKDNDDIKIHGKKIKIVEIEMTPDLNLEKKVIINGINVFWVTSGLQPFLNQIRESAKYNRVTTISNDHSMVANSFVAMGAQKTESGYKVCINLKEAQNINMNIDNSLLSSAIVIR